MLKSRLLVSVLVATFAMAATTDLAFAKKHHASAAAEAGGIPACGKGMVPEYHDMTAHPHWHCVKPS